MGEEVRTPDLPPLTVVLLEDIAARLMADKGHWRLELDFVDGTFQVAWRHNQVPTQRLRAFDVAAGALNSQT